MSDVLPDPPGSDACAYCLDPGTTWCVSCDAWVCNEHRRLSSYSDEYHCDPRCAGGRWPGVR